MAVHAPIVVRLRAVIYICVQLPGLRELPQYLASLFDIQMSQNPDAKNEREAESLDGGRRHFVPRGCAVPAPCERGSLECRAFARLVVP